MKKLSFFLKVWFRFLKRKPSVKTFRKAKPADSIEKHLFANGGKCQSADVSKKHNLQMI
ncbi:MAG: hypothetical protein RR550_01815 [Rikenellaceae bacterium]